ncbi:SRPBCC domain-containing protein [Paenibacillus sp. P96]|uniref:SRPBCC domain-containing protein n=1 Tax=Paenibacillus zeirhizosphaerae TaxID=2987519 RepID=A0ABT9FVR8_9BACL|nr:SRPBCC domain-containing protein [Paenibacillus sp. P96]MDP4098813.1 SRPBCC domain-containing protein [Paenibacillus sp. P96]
MNMNNNEIITMREFDVPRELVYQAWTTPELLARWWGPNGFTNTFHKCEIKLGGVWQLTMHGPDGKDYPNESVFVEVVPVERVVLDHLSGHQFRITATFDDLDGRTKVTFRQTFRVKEDFEKAKDICVEANEQNLDRLGQVLKEMNS